MDIDLTPLLTGAIIVVASACSAFITAQVAPKVNELWMPIRSRYPLESAFLEAQIVAGIKGVEKQYGAGQGDQKLAAVLIFVEKQAKRYHCAFDEFVVSTLIHTKLQELEDKASTALTGEN